MVSIVQRAGGIILIRHDFRNRALVVVKDSITFRVCRDGCLLELIRCLDLPVDDLGTLIGNVLLRLCLLSLLRGVLLLFDHDSVVFVDWTVVYLWALDFLPPGHINRVATVIQGGVALG